MSLVSCKDCGKSISKNAEVCPYCKFSNRKIKASKLLSCHQCGEVLEINKYRKVRGSSYSYLENGNTRYGSTSWVDHQGCPKCGEPKPLIYFHETVIGAIVSYTLFLSFVICFSYSAMKMLCSLLHECTVTYTNFDSSGYFGTAKYQVISDTSDFWPGGFIGLLFGIIMYMIFLHYYDKLIFRRKKH